MIIMIDYYHRCAIIIIYDNNERKIKMGSSKADAILHPIRMRIIQELASKPCTVQELLQYLQDVPQATLYRHLNTLKKAEVVEVIKEQKIRGTVEKTYALAQASAILSGDEVQHLTKEEHLQHFMNFYTMLAKEFEAYLEGDVNFEKDGFGYHQLPLHLSDSEQQAFLEDYKKLVGKYQFKPREDRRKRTMAVSFIPERQRGEN